MKIQDDILNSTSKNELVSAGAGSGKTTVMINKISNLIIEKHVPVENFLVVTFTVLAATEMKERLIKNLQSKLEESNDKENILNVIEQIKTASIDTIDGFNSKTIKKYFYELNISPNIEIISDATRDYFLMKAMRKTIEQYSKTDKINILLDLFGGNRRNFKSLEEMILSIYFKVVNLYDYNKFLTDSINEYKNPVKSENVVNSYICDNVNILKAKIIESGAKNEKIDDFFKILSQFNKNLSLKTNLSFLKNLVEPKFSAAEKKDEAVNFVSSNIKDILALKKEIIENDIDENFDLKNEKIVIYFEFLIEILQIFIKNYNSIKEKNNLIDFNDLNRLMLKLLENENVKAELISRYKYIFIDEYQDVNPLQDMLMSNLIGKDTTVFMVGDVKQSIYGFRGASPEWFLNKYNNLKLNKNAGEVFDMNINFRSNPLILQFINDIFEKLMTKNIADIDYKNDCLIEPMRDDIVDNKVNILLVKKSDKELASGLYSVKNDNNEKEQSTDFKQAMLVAKIITELIDTEFYDASIKSTRLLTYSDIAILTQTEKGDAYNELIDVLKSIHIPLDRNNKVEVNLSEGIKLVLSILKCVTNSADDVDFLACFMALTNLTLNDFIKLRDKDASLKQNLENYDSDEARKGFQILDDIKNNSYTKSNSELIHYILDKHKLKYYFLLKPNGEKELNLIEDFLNKLSSYENNLSLNEFIDVILNNVTKSNDINSSDGENSVTIQTIHKSKGLEYPVVILFDSSREFSYLRDKDAIYFNEDIGLGVDYYDTANRVKNYSLTKYAIKIKNQFKSYKEQLRLLYVALTRAKNKLYIVGDYSENYFKENPKNTCYTNMILSCYDGLIEGGNSFNNVNINFYDNIEVINRQEGEFREVDTAKIDFTYPNANKFNISVKNTVTGLNSKYSETNNFSTRAWLKPEMQYDYEENRALVGTHYHKALQNLDFSSAYQKNTDFADVDYKKIELAHKNISKLTDGAINIYKEAEFMMFVPYNDLVQSDVKDKVLVQGVVDLMIEYPDSFSIVDYKFSNLTAKSLKQKYAEQLKLYSKAVEEAYHKPVKHTYIYSINSGELV